VFHVPAIMSTPVLFGQRSGFIDRRPSGRSLGETFIFNPFHPVFLDPPDISSECPFTHPQDPAGFFLCQASFLPFIPRLFKAHLSDLLQHGRSVHRGPPLNPDRTGQPLCNKTGQIMNPLKWKRKCLDPRERIRLQSPP
jgi:hypothetical protein